MAVAKTKKNTMILIKICIRGFTTLLIMNPLSEFHNLRWRIQMAVAKAIRKSTIMLIKISTQGFLVSLVMNPLSDFYKSKWRIQYGGRRNLRKHNDIGKNMYSDFVKVPSRNFSPFSNLIVLSETSFTSAQSSVSFHSLRGFL